MRALRSYVYILVHLMAVFPNPTIATCECGYFINTATTNSTSDSSPTFFDTILETDFLHLASLKDTQDWVPQNYTVDAQVARGPYGKNASLNNISPNPLSSLYDWAGNGANGSDAGLQLNVRAGSAAPASSLIGMSELVTNRSDILYGSFRAGVKMTGVNGTCGAFFFYRNDTQEIDIELLSTQQQSSSYTVNVVLQSTESLQQGFNAAGTPGFLPYHLPFDPTASFHEYRYDWTPHAVSFYADGVLLDTMTRQEDIPHSPGGIHFSHWSNGDPAWSGGPPASDAVLTVSYFKAYFNTSSISPSTTCPVAICKVPDLLGAPADNASTRAAWFADGGDGKNGTGKALGPKGTAAGVRDRLQVTLGLIAVVVGFGALRGLLW